MKIRQARKIGKSRRRYRWSTLRGACSRFLSYDQKHYGRICGYDSYMLAISGYPNFGWRSHDEVKCKMTRAEMMQVLKRPKEFIEPRDVVPTVATIRESMCWLESFPDESIPSYVSLNCGSVAFTWLKGDLEIELRCSDARSTVTMIDNKNTTSKTIDVVDLVGTMNRMACAFKSAIDGMNAFAECCDR